MNLFVQATLLLIQWVSGICIFMLFYIWFFKKYKNPKCHIFTIYYAIIGFSFISEVLKTIFPQIEYLIRFTTYFVTEPLSILVLAFFISIIALNKHVKNIYLISIVILLVINMIPHLPYEGLKLTDLQYPKFNYYVISTFVFILLALLKMIRDYGESDKISTSAALWGFLVVSYVQKAAGLTFSGAGLYTDESSTYSAILMLMMILSFLLLVKVFYETIIKDKVHLKATVSITELLAMEENELVHYIHQNHPGIINKFREYRISDRELTIIFLTLFGISMKDCADYLNVTVKTVEQYRYRLKKKIGLDGSLTQSLREMNVETI